jgi:peroxiredoxin
MASPGGEPSPARVGLWLGQIAFVIVAALFVSGFVAVTKESESRRVCGAPCILRPDYMAAERRAPSFTLSDGKGASVSMESLRGKVVILNFWTKTCGPCLEEMPDLADLAKILRDRSDVAVVTVSTDEGPEDVAPTLKSVLHEAPPFTVLFDPDGDKVVSPKFGTRLFPETWIIDKRGVIRARFDGARDWSSAVVVEYIDALRRDEFCDVVIDRGRMSSKLGKLCEQISGMGG